jgi:ketosteroid isomerase-like protein
MSQENINALQRLYERWAAGDWSETSLFDPHVVGVFPDPNPVALYGLESLGIYIRRFLESWDDFRVEATAYREVGDSCVVEVHRSGVGKSSGMPMEDHAFLIWTFRGGRVIRVDAYDSEAEALEALGLSD